MADERFLAMFDSGDLSNLRCETNIASALLNAPEVLPSTTRRTRQLESLPTAHV